MDTEKITSSPFAIGALGAIITAIKFTPGASWPERTANVMAGSAFAGFITPALVGWLHMGAPQYLSGAAFLFGLVGMSLADSVLTAIKELPLAKIITGWISRRGGES